MDLSGLLGIIEDSPSLQGVRETLRSSQARLTVGVVDTAKAAAVAALVRRWPSPCLVIVSRPQRAEALAEELTAWLGESGRVFLFPERDPLPYERLAPTAEVVQGRLRTLAALAGGGSQVVVASGLALAQRTLSPQEIRTSTLVLGPGQRLEMEPSLRQLAALGYRLEPLVLEPGQASRRGGIIDVFPSTADLPIRIELVGQQVESLRLFDPATQRSLRSVDRVEIGPAREMVAPGGQAREMAERLDISRCAAQVRQRFQEELSLLEKEVSFRGDHFYVPFLAGATLLEHLPPSCLVILDEESEVATALEEAQEHAESSRRELEERGEIPRGLPSPLEPWARLRSALEEMPLLLGLSRWASGEGAVALRLPFVPAASYGGQLQALVADALRPAEGLRRTVIVSQQAQRLAELFAEEGAAIAVLPGLWEEPSRLALVQGSLPAGWWLKEGGLDVALITDMELFGFAKQRRAAPRKARGREAFLTDLSPGDYVVHVDHGLARFAGMVLMTTEGHQREYLELHYAEGDRLFVPVDQLDRVSRYLGPTGQEPHLTRLGSGDWQQAKRRVSRAVRALARELVALYAAREVFPGHPYSPDTPWQAELEASFPYVETADQLEAIAQVKRDMEAPRPMDRLVCGDVGYGKTEVALRAAFKAIMEGRQVAVLVPTTVLGQQHYQTFLQRLAPFPLRVEMLSRFRSEAEQRRIVADLASGAIDIVIGTHRLLQKDVAFKDLGLVIIDEEQRFGVAHKEQLKRLRREVDVLTLSATPIPRTLYMALGGIRDVSTMETPPEERLPIKTYVSEFDEHVVREAILRELERGGQVYFLHNRVQDIHHVAHRLQEMVPEARVGIAHGQMEDRELERAMTEFVQGHIDVLVCTTIIESGLDIPNVNTIIMDQADKLGLAQLYQLRGRVGRGAHRAYAYLLYDRKARLTEAARQRLQAIFQATELGAGFQIALRDLEIRGAGNLLGPEQSGFMAAVGFDLYCRLLAQEVERLRAIQQGKPLPLEGEVTIDLPLTAHLPPSYVPDPGLRLALYQRLSRAAQPEEVSALGQEMVDRFGEPPTEARNLLYIVLVRVLAAAAGVQSILTEGGEAVVRLREGLVIPWEALEGRAPRGVHLGRTQLRVELGAGWRERLRQALELLTAARKERALSWP